MKIFIFCMEHRFMNPNIRVQSILDRYPDSEQTFRMYDINISDDSVLQLTLDAVSEQHDVELEDLLMDLEELIQENRSTRWISTGGEDNWTEGFTEEVSSESNYDATSKGFDGTEEFDGTSGGTDFDMD
jgi:hypothetical protein